MISFHLAVESEPDVECTSRQKSYDMHVDWNRSDITQELFLFFLHWYAKSKSSHEEDLSDLTSWNILLLIFSRK